MKEDKKVVSLVDAGKEDPRKQVVEIVMDELYYSEDGDYQGRVRYIYENPKMYGIQSGFCTIMKESGEVEYFNVNNIYSVIQRFVEE